MSKEFQSIEEAAAHNPFVCRWWRQNISTDQCILAMANAHERLVEELSRLYSIAPRRFRLPDGKEYVWRCPDRLIPLTDFSKKKERDDAWRNFTSGSSSGDRNA